MTRVGLLSDTHSHVDEKIIHHLKTCDEIWHAGDIGDMQVVNRLSSIALLRAVSGNIESGEVYHRFPEQLVFTCEEVKVLMRHITGYPKHYDLLALAEIESHKPDLVIGGHSHILRIMYDEHNNCLFMNPGSAGQEGQHLERTLIRFTIDGKQIRNAEVIELGKRGR